MFYSISVMELTPREREVLEFLAEYGRSHGHPPSVREICQGLGLKSPGSLHKVLRRLAEKGAIEMEPRRGRTIRLRAHSGGRTIPVMGRIAAGLPMEAVEELEEELPCDPTLFGGGRCFGLLVKGDSMVGLHIAAGDIAIIEPTEEVKSGEVAAVMVEGVLPEATLKVVKLSPGAMELHAANPAYPPMVFRGEEQRAVRIVGRMVGLIRRWR